MVHITVHNRAPDDSLDSPRTLVTASKSMYEGSEATTLYEEYFLDDTSSSKVYVVKPETENTRRRFYALYRRRLTDTARVKAKGDWQWGDNRYPNKALLLSNIAFSRSLRKILSSFIGLFMGLDTRRRLSAINSQVELCRENYYPVSVKEIQAAYEYLYELEHHRIFVANNALTLRLSVLELLFDIWDNAVIFSEKRKDFFHKLWLDLDYESSRVNPKGETYKQISNLKHRFFLCVVSELPVNRSISEIIPKGSLEAVEALCKELAYGSGAYYIQKALRQIAETDWGHKELLCLSSQPVAKSELNERTNLITDCVTKLLSFKNRFSYEMAFGAFGRVAEYNQEAHALLTGPMGIAWLVDRLEEPTNMKYPAYSNYREGETYCHALMTACRNGFMNCVLECNIIRTLLRWIELFTIRGGVLYSAIEDNERDDSDVELGQIACCEFIILLMATPSGKKQFLDNSCALRTYLDLPSHTFSSWKLRTKLKAIAKLLKS